ncbi:MAG: cytochrome-c peroxidase [Bacteroidetes bacterium]|nr:cytochrome-c peroxidase [Bacteroidota bacterium]
MRFKVMMFPLVLLLVSCSADKKERLLYTDVQLGEALFFDPILSRDSTLSCASCHKPEFAFADTSRLSKGAGGHFGTRNTPSAMNQTDRNFYFWDGRSESLEHQALGPVENSVEMDFPATLLVKRLLRSEKYRKAFVNVYSKEPSKELISSALAAYERTLETNETPFDKYMSGRDTTLFSESAKRGLTLFNDKGKCFDCHFGPDFTGNDDFRNIGLYDGKKLNDKGRYLVTGASKDLGRFKVSGLRNIANTAPYMHNGMFKTLREVIDYYDQPDKFVPNSVNRDSLLKKPLGLTETEKKDLENFLKSLSDDRFIKK